MTKKKSKIELVEFPIEPEFKLDMNNIKSSILIDLKEDIKSIKIDDLDLHNGLEELLKIPKTEIIEENIESEPITNEPIEPNEEKKLTIVKKISFFDKLFKILG